MNRKKIKFTSEDLRRLADIMDNNTKYDNMCGVAYLSIKEYPNGRQYAEFEQPCSYADCNSSYYRFEEK